MSASTAHAPPQNIAAEEAVLGAMMVAESALSRVIDEVKLSAKDFYLDKHRLIFGCVRDLHAASKPVDELTVADELARRGEVEEVGGKHYVSALAAKVPAAGNAKHYAEIVKREALERKKREVAHALLSGLAPADAIERLAALVSLSTSRRVELTTASSIRSERVRFLDRGRLPLRGLTVVAGEKGLGKSIFTNAYLPAKLTRGELDGELSGRPADALVVTAEDDWASVVKPRQMIHGADLDRVHRVRVLDEAGQVTLTLPDDVALVEAELDRLHADGRRVALLVIDPISAFLGERTDSHKDASVRRALAPLAAMAERRDLAVVVVAHLTKDESRRLISRVSGSGAFVNASRSVLGFARDPDDPDGERGKRRVLVQAASNWGDYAPSLGLRVEGRDVEVDDGSTADVGYLVVTGEVDVGVEELQSVGEESGAGTEEEITAKLASGQRLSREVKAEVAAELGCSRKTVERAATRMAGRGELKIESGGFPRTTTWTLSEDTAVGTSPNTEGVPTEQLRALEANSTPDEDSGDGPGGSGMTEAAPCRYPAHREHDYIGKSGLPVCGVCHPQPRGSA
jgi:hypothetical protein